MMGLLGLSPLAMGREYVVRLPPLLDLLRRFPLDLGYGPCLGKHSSRNMLLRHGCLLPAHLPLLLERLELSPLDVGRECDVRLPLLLKLLQRPPLVLGCESAAQLGGHQRLKGRSHERRPTGRRPRTSPPCQPARYLSSGLS